jgi:hypothetical protein
MGLFLLVGAWVTAALAGSASALPAAHVVPPPGTPDLSQMVLQPSDFSHAGTLGQNGYTTPSSVVIVADYTRVFGPSTVGRTRFAEVGSDASLFTDATTATVAFQDFNGLARTRHGRKELLQSFIQGFNQSAGRPVLRIRDLHFQRVHGLGVGDGSFILPTTFGIRGISLDFLYVRVDRAFGTLALLAIGKIHPADAAALAGAIANHMRTALAAPPSGTTVQR